MKLTFWNLSTSEVSFLQLAIQLSVFTFFICVESVVKLLVVLLRG